MDILSSVLQKAEPLDILNFNLELPDNWDEQVVATRSKYMSQKRMEMNPRNLAETLESIIQIIRLEIQELPDSLCEALAWNTVGLFELFTLLSDEEVNEILGSELGLPLVVTHRKYGRCSTNVLFSKELWDAMKLRAEFDTGESLNPTSPALKAGFETNIGSIRLSMQTPPLSINGPAFSIRRLPVTTIDMQRLIQDKQISEMQAAYLTKMVKERANIIIAGEPGSGKTTLANALLMQTNPAWRLIVIEDAKEVRFNSENFPLLTRFSMPAVGSEKRYSRRTSEIARLLHRSPDYVFLGEIQNKDDTTASMEALAAGIRGMATTHAHDLRGLLARWELSHGLSHDLLRVIDTIVITKREIKGGKSYLGLLGIYQLVLKDGEFTGFTQVDI